MTDTQFINRLIKASNSYQNDLNYHLRPDWTSGYSNSYVSGVLQAAGAAPPSLNTQGQFQAPDYDKPIPLNSGERPGHFKAGHQAVGTAGAQLAHGEPEQRAPGVVPLPAAKISSALLISGIGAAFIVTYLASRKFQVG